MQATDNKEKFRVIDELKYDPVQFAKRMKSSSKMADAALKGLDWKSMKKYLPSKSARCEFNGYRGTTRGGLKLMCNPEIWLGRQFFWTYNRYVYSRPSTPRRPVVDTLKLVQQRMPKNGFKGGIASLMGAACLFTAYVKLEI